MNGAGNGSAGRGGKQVKRNISTNIMALAVLAVLLGCGSSPTYRQCAIPMPPGARVQVNYFAYEDLFEYAHYLQIVDQGGAATNYPLRYENSPRNTNVYLVPGIQGRGPFLRLEQAFGVYLIDIGQGTCFNVSGNWYQASTDERTGEVLPFSVFMTGIRGIPAQPDHQLPGDITPYLAGVPELVNGAEALGGGFYGCITGENALQFVLAGQGLGEQFIEILNLNGIPAQQRPLVDVVTRGGINYNIPHQYPAGYWLSDTVSAVTNNVQSTVPVQPADVVGAWVLRVNDTCAWGSGYLVKIEFKPNGTFTQSIKFPDMAVRMQGKWRLADSVVRLDNVLLTNWGADADTVPWKPETACWRMVNTGNPGRPYVLVGGLGLTADSYREFTRVAWGERVNKL